MPKKKKEELEQIDEKIEDVVVDEEEVILKKFPFSDGITVYAENLLEAKIKWIEKSKELGKITKEEYNKLSLKFNKK